MTLELAHPSIQPMQQIRMYTNVLKSCQGVPYFPTSQLFFFTTYERTLSPKSAPYSFTFPIPTHLRDSLWETQKKWKTKYGMPLLLQESTWYALRGLFYASFYS